MKIIDLIYTVNRGFFYRPRGFFYRPLRYNKDGVLVHRTKRAEEFDIKV